MLDCLKVASNQKVYVGMIEGKLYISKSNHFLGYGDKAFLDEGKFKDMNAKYPDAEWLI